MKTINIVVQVIKLLFRVWLLFEATIVPSSASRLHAFTPKQKIKNKKTTLLFGKRFPKEKPFFPAALAFLPP